MALKLYACGGTGIDIINALESNYDYAHFDTSRSNIRRSSNPESTYLVPGVDGGGQNRERLKDVIRQHIEPFLSEHEPAEWNIVIGNTSGGTGSVAAPMIMKRLIEMGHQVIGVFALSNQSRPNVANSLDTFKSLNHIAKVTGTPVNIVAESLSANGNDVHNLDKQLALTINILSVALCNDHDRLDKEDIRNWMNYNVVTSAKPSLGVISIATDDEMLSTHTMNPISLLSIYKDPDESYDPSILNYSVEYVTSGHSEEFLTVDGSEIAIDGPLHLIIEQGRVANISNDIKTQLAAYDKAARARIAQPNDFDVDEDDEGIIC